MKFTLSWLKEHLDTDATIDEVVDAMTLAGLEVEDVENPAEKLAAFSIAKKASGCGQAKSLSGRNQRRHEADRVRRTQCACRHDRRLCPVGRLHSRS